ncbi:MAG TPA: patatin-like phospholipase family protein [Rhodoblastus sp.]|nr:patatin-like phospholipase family protein [Rhodoblastus sp.]
MAEATRIGLALAGGGPLGSIYEIGALVALQEAFDGVDLTQCHATVGVSAGAFIAASLANGLTPRDLCARFIESENHPEPFEPDFLMRPAFAEYARRLVSLPDLALEALATWLDRSGSAPRGAFEALQGLARALPNGVFDNDAAAAYLARMFGRSGRTDDFRRLRHKLFIVATDLDSADAVVFGAPGFDDTPISAAVKASAALPGLYPPARIGQRDYVDGALKKTLHASVALKAGAKLLICVNPLVPFDARLASVEAGRTPRRLADDGLATVLSQTFRALIQSRMKVGMARYAHDYPDADILLFEPARDDALIFFANVFSYADRRRLAEHAYSFTRSELRRRAAELEAVLSRHGVRLNHAVLADPDRRLIAAPARPAHGLAAETGRLAATLDRLDHALAQGAAAPTRARIAKSGRRAHAGETEKKNARAHS